MNTQQWRVTLPDGTTGTAVGWTDTGGLIVRRDEPETFWPEDLTTTDGKPLGYGFAAGLPIQGEDT
jgi:hypothetical protein